MNKRQELIERLSGNGQVFRDEQKIAEVNYVIEITQEYLTISSLEGESEVEERKRIDGQITVVEGERNLTSGEIFSLKLEDGRKWNFVATSGDPVTRTYSAVNASGGGLA